MTTDFQGRLHIGNAHEQHVADELERRGWHAEPFGQGLFSDEIKGALSKLRPVTLLRWIPDLIAVRERVVLVDPKSAWRDDTPNHSIEAAAWTHGLWIEAMWGIPLIYVFADLTCNRASRLKPVRYEPFPNGRIQGSGTPYVLIRKDDQRPFDDTFGEPPDRDGTNS